MIDEDVAASWQAELDAARTNEYWKQIQAEWDSHRTPAVNEALRNLLERFLSGEISLKQFQVIFDKNTRTVWDVFGLKGLSGAMFLNTLVKYMPDQEEVTNVLQQVVPVPQDVSQAHHKLAALTEAIDNTAAAGLVSKTNVQSSRANFFLSAWWHIQEREQWPVYYISMRRVLAQRGVWKPQQSNVVDDYLSFRQVTLDLARLLELDLWTLERLCLVLDRAPGGTLLTPSIPTSGKEDDVPDKSDGDEEQSSGSAHSHVQMLLAKLGKKFGCKVWIAQNDHGKQWQGEKLGSHSISNLPPLGIGDPAQNIVRLIDVIWLKGANQVVAAFEIEHTTSIYSGLLRMSDLAVLAPNTHFPVYIVAPDVKLPRVREQLRRPTFQHIELHQRTRFFSMESLIENAPNMLKWAGDPSAINQLAEQIGDVDEDATIPLGEDSEGGLMSPSTSKNTHTT